MNSTKIIEDFGLNRKESENLSKGLKAKIGSKIYVNDYGESKIVKKSKITAQLVIEEDGSVRWYVNPDEFRGDVVIKSVYVVQQEPKRKG